MNMPNNAPYGNVGSKEDASIPYEPDGEPSLLENDIRLKDVMRVIGIGAYALAAGAVEAVGEFAAWGMRNAQGE
jgi:hypothetical protein